MEMAQPAEAKEDLAAIATETATEVTEMEVETMIGTEMEREAVEEIAVVLMVLIDNQENHHPDNVTINIPYPWPHREEVAVATILVRTFHQPTLRHHHHRKDFLPTIRQGGEDINLGLREVTRGVSVERRETCVTEVLYGMHVA